jgi:spermidine synthase
MAGGFFNTFIAPRLFVSVGEYPLLIAAACFVMAEPALFRDLAVKRRLVVLPVLAGTTAAAVLVVGAMFFVPSEMLLGLLGIATVLCFAVSRHAASFALGIALLLAAGTLSSNRAWGDVLHAERTFFGVYRIASAAEGRLVSLFHGTTLHGSQLAEQREAPEPLSYYHRGSPIGNVFAALNDVKSVGVIGLGVGSLAAYARVGQAWTFYEIDPTVERIARDGRYFTFLETCGRTCRVVIGDGRLSIRFSAEKHDIIVLDAFSSDAIPVHLLTREAIDEYLGTLRDDGVLAFHISNRHFDLEPVLSRVAADRRLFSVVREAAVAGTPELGHLASRWVVMARNAEVLSPLASDPGWKTSTTDGRRVWTDDFSNVWSALERR